MGDIEEKRPDKEMEEEKEGEKEEQSQGKEKKTKREKRDREKRKKKRERSDKGKKKKKEEDDGEESEEEKIESLESEWGEERSEIDLYISDVLLKEMGWGGEGSIDATSEDAESRMSGGESERGGSERGGSERGGSERGGSEKGNSDRGSESGENGTREKRFNSAERFVGKDKGEGFSWVRTLKKKKERGPVVGSEWEIFLDFISMARSMARLIVLEVFFFLLSFLSLFINSYSLLFSPSSSSPLKKRTSNQLLIKRKMVPLFPSCNKHTFTNQFFLNLLLGN